MRDAIVVKNRVTRHKKCVMRVIKFVIIYERSGLVGKYVIKMRDGR